MNVRPGSLLSLYTTELPQIFRYPLEHSFKRIESQGSRSGPHVIDHRHLEVENLLRAGSRASKLSRSETQRMFASLS
jgi:hypothetical protein